MVDRQKLIERLMATFVDELAEHVETLSTGIIALESERDEIRSQEILSQLFRAAHSLKGASRAVDVTEIESTCHELEGVFTALRDQSIPMTSELASLILSVSDRIADAGQLLRDRQPVPADHCSDLPRLLTLAAKGELPAADLTSNARPDAGGKPVSVSAETEEPPTTAKGDGAPANTGDESQHSETEPHSDSARHRSSTGGTIRVAEEKLDSLMAQAGELLVARQRIEIRPRELETVSTLLNECRSAFQQVETDLLNAIRLNQHDPLILRSPRLAGRLEETVLETSQKLRRAEGDLEELQKRLTLDARQLNHTGEVLQEDIHRLRLVAFSDGCAGLDRAVRDAAQTTRKRVDFHIAGGNIEVDRTVLQGLRDPLLHLVRNAVDHGLESPDERHRAGKPETGNVSVEVRLRGGQVDIVVSDDGRGLDHDAILKRIRATGLPEPRDERELVRSVFLPGFSTAQKVTELSGRGVGMDVVRSQLEELHGTIDLSSQPGLGTRVSLSVPLTLTTVSALFVRAAGQVLAIPSTNVRRLVRFARADVRRMGGQDTLSLGGSPVPINDLATALALPEATSTTMDSQLTGIILTTGDRELVVTVDGIINERDAVVKNLGPQIRRVQHVSGATLLRSGGVALLLNVATLVRETTSSKHTLLPAADQQQEGTVARRVLVVDDSVTTRSLLRGILESAGYDVASAVDGADAWSQLQESPFEIVISDVDMPKMDGFALTSRIRESDKHSRLPVVLVTSRDTDDDRTRGVQSGASAYLVKSAFDQTHVLDVIEQLL